jgi:hypothetical protein
MTEEIWKSINLEKFGEYQVSTNGNVKNNVNHPISIRKFNSGYRTVRLLNKSFYVHRLVAVTFIPNPNNKPFVNHKDGNKSNNILNNLEWVTAAENTKHANEILKVKKFTKKILQFDLENKYISTYNSMKETAEKNNINRELLYIACKKSKPLNNFLWKYENTENINIEVDDSFKQIPNFPNYKINEEGKVYSVKNKNI